MMKKKMQNNQMQLTLTLSHPWYPIFIFLASRTPQTQRHHRAAISHQAAYSTTP